MTDYTITLAFYLVMAVGVLTGYLYAPKPPNPVTRKDWLPPNDGDGYVPIKQENIGEFLMNAFSSEKNKPYANPKKPQPWMGERENY